MSEGPSSLLTPDSVHQSPVASVENTHDPKVQEYLKSLKSPDVKSAPETLSPEQKNAGRIWRFANVQFQLEPIDTGFINQDNTDVVLNGAYDAVDNASDRIRAKAGKDKLDILMKPPHNLTREQARYRLHEDWVEDMKDFVIAMNIQRKGENPQELVKRRQALRNCGLYDSDATVVKKFGADNFPQQSDQSDAKSNSKRFAQNLVNEYRDPGTGRVDIAIVMGDWHSIDHLGSLAFGGGQDMIDLISTEIEAYALEVNKELSSDRLLKNARKSVNLYETDERERAMLELVSQGAPIRDIAEDNKKRRDKLLHDWEDEVMRLLKEDKDEEDAKSNLPQQADTDKSEADSDLKPAEEANPADNISSFVQDLQQAFLEGIWSPQDSATIRNQMADIIAQNRTDQRRLLLQLEKLLQKRLSRIDTRKVQFTSVQMQEKILGESLSRIHQLQEELSSQAEIAHAEPSEDVVDQNAQTADQARTSTQDHQPNSKKEEKEQSVQNQNLGEPTNEQLFTDDIQKFDTGVRDQLWSVIEYWQKYGLSNVEIRQVLNRANATNNKIEINNALLSFARLREQGKAQLRQQQKLPKK